MVPGGPSINPSLEDSFSFLGKLKYNVPCLFDTLSAEELNCIIAVEEKFSFWIKGCVLKIAPLFRVMMRGYVFYRLLFQSL